MPKKLVIHALFTYTDPSSKQRRTAFRGDTINVSKEDAARGERFGAFGTAADLVPAGLDEGVVDVPSQEPTGTPVVPLVSKASILEGALRDRLGVEAGATEADVLAALDQALAQAQSTPEPDADTQPAVGDTQPAGGATTQPAPEAAAGEVTVGNVPPAAEDELAEETGEVDEGPPPLAATKDRWEAYAVKKGMPVGEAAAKKKADLIALYGGG